MPRERKPARLWLEPARYRDDGSLRQAAVWVIRDGGKKHSTGCGAQDRDGAERALREHLIARHQAAAPTPRQRAEDVFCADVIAHYVQKVTVARPIELGSRAERLLDFWGEKTLADVTGYSCRAYAEQRSTPSAARRELADFRAAVRLYAADGLLRDHVVVTLPEKEEARLDYFTRDQVAALLWYCWRAREVQKGRETDKRHLRHLCRYILTAVYTGSRSARIWNASFERQVGRPWLDLDGGVYHRRPAGERATKKRAGSVRIPDRLLAHMRRWRRGVLRQDQKTREWSRVPAAYLVEWRGKPSNPKKAVAKAMDAVFGADHPYVAHSFRHTCATWLMWSRADVGDIAAYLSMTREMVVEVYGHEHPDADRAVGEIFSSGRAGRRPTVSDRNAGNERGNRGIREEA